MSQSICDSKQITYLKQMIIYVTDKNRIVEEKTLKSCITSINGFTQAYSAPYMWKLDKKMHGYDIPSNPIYTITYQENSIIKQATRTGFAIHRVNDFTLDLDFISGFNGCTVHIVYKCDHMAPAPPVIFDDTAETVVIPVGITTTANIASTCLKYSN